MLKGKYPFTIDFLFDWFGISCMPTDIFCFHLQNRLIQTSQTGGQLYSCTVSIPCKIQWSWREFFFSAKSFHFCFDSYHFILFRDRHRTCLAWKDVKSLNNEQTKKKLAGTNFKFRNWFLKQKKSITEPTV